MTQVWKLTLILYYFSDKISIKAYEGFWLTPLLFHEGEAEVGESELLVPFLVLTVKTGSMSLSEAWMGTESNDLIQFLLKKTQHISQ